MQPGAPGQRPTGTPLPDWTPREFPDHTPMPGRYCSLEPLSATKHAADLHAAFSDDAYWTYLPYGPFPDFTEFEAWIDNQSQQRDPQFYTIVSAETGKAVGYASYLRISPNDGVVEVGHINYSPALQKTIAATEAMYLMMHRVFEELGYRRYEWKCDSLNTGSRSAAERLGFQFEGIFRQATIYKGRNRDTAWFSILDDEWPRIKNAMELWLSLENFDSEGKQRKRLGEFR